MYRDLGSEFPNAIRKPTHLSCMSRESILGMKRSDSNAYKISKIEDDGGGEEQGIQILAHEVAEGGKKRIGR